MLSDINALVLLRILPVVLIDINSSQVATVRRLLPPRPLFILVDDDEIVITGLPLLLVSVEDDVLLHLVTGAVLITRLLLLVFIYEVVTGQVLLGLQRHELVVITDPNTGLGPGLLLVTLRELSLFRRLPRLPLVSEHLLLHVPHCPGRPGLVVQGALLEVSRAQPQSYPGHEGTLAGLEEEEGEQPTE